MSRPRTQVHLIPWDPDSEEHATKLIEQRELCGWDANKIPTWSKMQKAGSKCLFWITTPVEGLEAADEQHPDTAAPPQDGAPLQDTGVWLRGTARTPTHQFFHPVGHISLDSENPGADRAGLKVESERIYWIKTFYVMQSFQSRGVGRAAMDVVETMAIEEPLCARTLGLDTVEKEDFIMLEVMKSGKIPKSTNQEWYERRGYQVIKIVQNLYHEPGDEDKWPDFKAVFMKKDIA